jgi:hypothetical protein
MSFKKEDLLKFWLSSSAGLSSLILNHCSYRLDNYLH